MKEKFLQGEVAAVVGGSVLFGLAMGLFLTPCDIIMGGAGGAAITVCHFLPLPVGVVIALLNLPLLLIAVRMVGVRGMGRTIIAVGATSLLTDLFSVFPPATQDPLLAAVFGGAIMGVGSGMMLPRGYTTGGSDLAAYLLCKKVPRLQTGTVILAIDAAVVLGSAILLRSFSGIICSAAAVTAYTLMLDTVSGGLRRAKLSLIISPHYGEIGDAITQKMSRGATVLRGMGWYTEKERNVVMCVIRRSELYALKTLVRQIDANAFMIITDAAEVLGHGFEKH